MRCVSRELPGVSTRHVRARSRTRTRLREICCRQRVTLPFRLLVLLFPFSRSPGSHDFTSEGSHGATHSLPDPRRDATRRVSDLLPGIPPWPRAGPRRTRSRVPLPSRTHGTSAPTVLWGPPPLPRHDRHTTTTEDDVGRTERGRTTVTTLRHHSFPLLLVPSRSLPHPSLSLSLSLRLFLPLLMVGFFRFALATAVPRSLLLSRFLVLSARPPSRLV